MLLGQVFVKTTLNKDGHTFVLHVLEPMDPQDDAELTALIAGPPNPEKPAAESATEKAETEAPEKSTDAGELPKFNFIFASFFWIIKLFCGCSIRRAVQLNLVI